MTTDNSQQFLFYLRQYGISNTMITILEKQHINDEDLQMIDRDDVDHLFRNEYGFTFRDRKHFWNILQKIQLSQVPNLKNEQIINSTEILDYIYEFGEEEDEDIDNTHSKEQSFLSSTSNTDRQSTNTNLFDNKILSDDKNGNDEDNNSNSSSYVSNVSLSADYVFTYPTVLPSFSANITQALKTNTIHKQWAPFINELARWVMSIKPSLREQHEYRSYWTNSI